MTEDELLAERLTNGVLDLYVDEDGNEQYRLGPNAEELDPELVHRHAREIDEALYALYQKGLADFSLNEDGEIVWGLTEVGASLLDKSV